MNIDENLRHTIHILYCSVNEFAGQVWVQKKNGVIVNLKISFYCAYYLSCNPCFLSFPISASVRYIFLFTFNICHNNFVCLNDVVYTYF